MKRRGSLLIELLAACFCLGIVGLLVLQLIVPCIVAAQRYLNDEGDRTGLALTRIRQEVGSSLPAGVSFASQSDGWTLGIVPLDTPGSTGKRLWKSELIVYRFQNGAIVRSLLSDLKWPDGTPRLTGAEPAPFSADELSALDTRDARVLAQSLEGEPWSSLEKPWPVRFLGPGGKTRAYLLNLADVL